MKKVYCKNCYADGEMDLSYVCITCMFNKNNNCKNYKRKWWKFWVK